MRTKDLGCNNKAAKFVVGNVIKINKKKKKTVNKESHTYREPDTHAFTHTREQSMSDVLNL